MRATTTSKTEKVIGLWLDTVGGDEPKWIVSRDTWCDGEPDTTTTVRIFDRGEFRAAKVAAMTLAARDGVRLLHTDLRGDVVCLYAPVEGAPARIGYED